MPSTTETIQNDIVAAAVPGFRGRLIARGQARSMIWRNGQLPPGAPAFSPLLSYDLHSYGYSLLLQGLRLLDMGGDAAIARKGFEQAATALEAARSRADPNDPDRDFHFVMTAAAYHMARLSARAFSLLGSVRDGDNFSPTERALALLMLRDLNGLERLAMSEIAISTGADERIVARFAAQLGAADTGSASLLDGVDDALNDQFARAMATLLLALERGDAALLDQAIATLRIGVSVCEDLNLVPQWWSHSVAIHLLRDIWDTSFHTRLPIAPAGGVAAADWTALRQLFLAVLLRRNKAEIDLWPSQLEAAARAADQTDDLVVSLPTSAGKTRIAELCILRCLAAQKRIVFITPLRALSAQTEVGLQRTFGPLGKTISALYGSIGVSGFDEDAIRSSHIVVATPEKLDFALRNDPSLLDDVGLLVFDEGHMIGMSEREVRYEVQIQRLLRRADAAGRRIVCLSAILPDGDQLDDFAAWLRRDQPGGLVKSDWRPTRLRYGEVVWTGQHARLNLRVGDERPFVPRFLTGAVPPIGRRKKIFPDNLGELCLATAWRLVQDGQSVLVFCPVRAHVEPFADRIIKLHIQGALPSLLTVPVAALGTTLALGAEWLGANHPILACLKLGVAIHHGALPTAFRKEVERLLRDNVLKVMISSPTLAQGLNLSATAVIMHSLHRNRERIETSEFKNVIGRAGRAYVDVEGLVLYPIFDRHADRVAQWEQLIADLSLRQMESGLLRLVITLLDRMRRRLGNPSMEQLADYVANNTQAWQFTPLPGENAETQAREAENWQRYVTSLDTAVLSLIGDDDIADDGVPAALDNILQSSLWQRRLVRRGDNVQMAIKAGLVSRAKHIWHNSDAVRRRGYFLAGVGLQTGHALDALAPIANDLLIEANGAVLVNEPDRAIAAITTLAEHVFVIPPFVPDKLPDNWRDILALWLGGHPIAALAAGQEAETLQFVENGLVYRLPWAMEAIRVRGLTHGAPIGDMGLTLDDFELGVAVSAVETGTLNRSAALLIQAGFTSRLAAIKAVADTAAEFSSGAELRQWMRSAPLAVLSADPAWPTPETHALWNDFARSFERSASAVWTEKSFWAPAQWRQGLRPAANSALRILPVAGRLDILSPDGRTLGTTQMPLNPARQGLLRISVHTDLDKILLSYLGPEDLWLA
jgi:superfamily II DNA/RNA helicase